ncbi:MAG: 3-hydroxyacyl-ACP dehydratase FabZ family protein [bacterium]
MPPVEVLDTTAVHALLAHRYPFLLVDRIAIMEPGVRVIGSKRVTRGEWWCVGSAERDASLPFSLVIEALAQTSGALIRDLVTDSAGVVAYFMGVSRVRLRHPARPGDELRLELTMRQWRRGICRTRGEATVDGRLVASADLTTIVRVSS